MAIMFFDLTDFDKMPRRVWLMVWEDMEMVSTACHFIKISQVKKHDCHWIPGWLGMLRNEELLIRKNLVGPFWRNLTCSDFTMEQNSWKWGKMFSFFAFWGIMMQFYKFLHIIWIFPQNNWNFLYFMLLSMKFVPKPSKSIGKCRILVPEIHFWLFEGLGRHFTKISRKDKKIQFEFRKNDILLIFFKIVL